MIAFFVHHLPHLVKLLRRPNGGWEEAYHGFFYLSTFLTLVDPQFISADTRALTQLLQFGLEHERTTGSDDGCTVFVKCTYAERTITIGEVRHCYKNPLNWNTFLKRIQVKRTLRCGDICIFNSTHSDGHPV